MPSKFNSLTLRERDRASQVLFDPLNTGRTTGQADSYVTLYETICEAFQIPRSDNSVLWTINSPARFLDFLYYIHGINSRSLTVAQEALLHKDNGPLLLLDSSPPTFIEPNTLPEVVQRHCRGLPAVLNVAVLFKPLPSEGFSAFRLFNFSLQGQSRSVAQILSLSVLSAIMALLPLYLTPFLFSQVVPTSNLHEFFSILAVVLFATLLSSVAQYLNSLVVLRLILNYDLNSLSPIFDRIMQLPVAFFRDNSTGDLIQRLFSIQEIRQTLTRSFATFVSSLIQALLTFLLVELQNWKYGLLVLLASLVYPLLSAILAVVQIRLTARKLALQGLQQNKAIEIIANISKLRLLGLEDFFFNRWTILRRQTYYLDKALAVIQVFDTFVSSLYLPLGIGAFFFYISYVAEQNQIDNGLFVFIIAAFGSLSTSLTSLAKSVVELSKIIPSSKRLDLFCFAEPTDRVLGHFPEPLRGDIKAIRLEFRYSRSLPAVFQDVNLHIAPGQFVAFVGESGCGKSTLLKVLAGIEAPSAGSVLFDNLSISSLDKPFLHTQLGYVTQNTQLLAASIFENITGFANNEDPDAVWQVLEAVGIADFVHMLPMKLDTLINEQSSNLSGGQRQCIQLARALFKRPPILILDEATSALDEISQRRVMQNIRQRNCTLISIAHRLSTIRDADFIYAMAGGGIRAAGTYAELQQEGILPA